MEKFIPWWVRSTDSNCVFAESSFFSICHPRTLEVVLQYLSQLAQSERGVWLALELIPNGLFVLYGYFIL